RRRKAVAADLRRPSADGQGRRPLSRARHPEGQPRSQPHLLLRHRPGTGAHRRQKRRRRARPRGALHTHPGRGRRARPHHRLRLRAAEHRDRGAAAEGNRLRAVRTQWRHRLLHLWRAVPLDARQPDLHRRRHRCRMSTTLDIDQALDAERRIAEFEREIAKLRKINAALMDRVERSIDAQGSAFSLFQTAIVLETKVRERTAELKQTLSKLERSYAEVAAAKEQFETAQTRLMAAIESVSEGFALFDPQDRLVLFNPRYLTFWLGISNRIQAGIPFREIVRLAADHKGVVDAYHDPEEWVRSRLLQHANPQGPSVHALSDGRWRQVNEKRTSEGGIVSVYTDISDLKRRETLQRETELAQKSSILQATLDNIFEGVAVYDRNLVLIAWNNEFVRLFNLPSSVACSAAGFGDFIDYVGGLGSPGGLLGARLAPPDSTPLKFEIGWRGGRILEAQRNPMPDGGFVLTFYDITRRKRIEEALRDGERRIRLITDAMPALISYVDAGEVYRFVNEPYCRWVGQSEDRVIGRRMAEVLTSESYERRGKYIARALSGETITFELELTPSGAPVPAYGLATFVPHFGEDCAILGFFTLMQDITERRRIEAALKEAKETL